MAKKSKTAVGESALRSRLQILIPSIIVLIGVIVSAIYADFQQQRLGREAARNDVEESLGLIRTKLEGNLNANIRLLQGMAAVIGTEPYVTQQRFENLSASLLENPSQIRNIVAAPDLITTFVYPYERNKSFIGTRMLTTPAGEVAAVKLRHEGKTVINGPVTLKNGSAGLIVTLPVHMINDAGQKVFWGGLAGIVDLSMLYRDSGLETQDLALAISEGNSATGGRTIIYGNGDILTDDPVTMTVDLGNKRWAISAVPTGGWATASKPDTLIRTMILAMAGLIAGTVVWVAMLMRERQHNYAALGEREEELRAMSHRLGAALATSKIGVWELDIKSNSVTWDEQLYQLYGLPPGTPITQQIWEELLETEDCVAINTRMEEAIEKAGSYTGEFRARRPDGELIHFRTVGTAFRDHKGETRVLGVNWDVSADVRLQEELRQAQRETALRNEELEAARQRMEHNALHDALTGLPNRRYLDQRLEQLIDSQEATGATLRVLHMDLDRFKEINDTLGHGAGDAILRNVARELEKHESLCDFVARIGGDEFVIVCTRPGTDENYEALGNQLIEAINKPILYNGHECRVGASIGIAQKTEPGLTCEQLLVNADIALYEAKRRGRNRVEHFSDQLRARTINIKTTADAILRSLQDDDFVAYFQPQFDARTLQINGVEALARWRHPEKGILAPNAFLDIADSLNVVAQIDAKILDQALAELARWHSEGLGIEHVSVNISAQRLFEEALLDHLGSLSIKPGSLSFELLESISFDDKADAVAASLDRIRERGISIEIDDFGTGYASILSLIKLSPSRLKIDRQLVAPIVVNPTQRKLISSIIDIGRSFGIGIVAEGVETMEHAAILRDLGCNTLQGYALARPMSPDSFIDFAKAHVLKSDDRWQRSA